MNQTLAQPGIAPFELGVVCEVFGADRTDAGLPAFEFAVISEEPGVVPSSTGFDITTKFGLKRAAEADLICIPAAGRERAPSPQILDMLRAGVDRGARVLGVCTGAFTLADAGLLDGRPCTTHWSHVDADPVFTSAGTAAASTPVCTWCARSTGPLSRTEFPVAW